MILVVCALPEELPAFAPSDDVALLACGVGPVDAAAATARALASRRYNAVVSAGIAGAFRGCANVGDACVLGQDVLADLGREDRSPLHLPGGASLAERVFAAPLLTECARDLPYPVLAGLTSTQVTTSETTARRLRDLYRADVETMESFAVLRAAAIARAPAIGVRGISNIVGPRESGAWDFRAGAQAAVAALRLLLLRLAALQF